METFQIDSEVQMIALGRALGEALQPLLSSESHELRAPVIATYGYIGSGKTIFLTSCTDIFLFDISKSLYKSIQPTAGNIFRYNDCSIIFKSAFEPRAELNMPGADFLENPPLSHIAPGVVVAIRNPAFEFEHEYTDAHLKNMLSRAAAELINPTSAQTQTRHLLEKSFSERFSSSVRETTRFVSVGLTLDNDVARKAFENFRRKTRNFTIAS